MEATIFNPTQLHLLKNEESLDEIKKALTAYFSKKVEDEMDELWEIGEWDDKKNESILKEHLRTSYRD